MRTQSLRMADERNWNSSSLLLKMYDKTQILTHPNAESTVT